MKRVTLYAIILAFAASSVTLWLLESPLKIILYFFVAALILTVYYSLYGNLKIRFKTKGNAVAKFDYIFVMISLILLSLIILKSDTILNLVCAIVVSFFLPGYVLLRLLNFSSLNSWLEWLVLSFALSIGLTSLIFAIAQPFAAYRAIIISAIYLSISVFPLLKDWIKQSSEIFRTHGDSRVNEHHLFDALLLLWVSLFFIFIISSLYPQMAYSPGLDIVRLYSSSRLLTLAPDVFQSTYPWFHTTCATVYELSSPPIEIFQTGLAYLSLIAVFSFYIMAKAYLSNINKRAPILATIFFSVFSGFGWLSFLGNKLTTLDIPNQLDILGVSNNASYWDVGYGQGPWVWLWFRPMTISFMLFFVLLYLLRRQNIPKLTFVTIFSFLITTLGFIHVPELILFSVFLLLLTLFMSKMPNMRLKEASLATLIGSITYFSYAWISGISPADMSMGTLLILPITATISYILAHKSHSQIMTNSSASWKTRSVEFFAGAIALIFMVGLLTWLSSPSTFSVSQVFEAYYIPVMMYPVLLGIVGFFALPGLAIVVKKYRSDPVVVLVLLFLVVLAWGKIVSFLNVEFLDLGYYERRFLPLIFAAASIVASVSLVKQASNFLKDKRKFLSATLVALVIVAGITSTSLSVEYWELSTEMPKISPYALEAADYMSSPSNRDIRTPILTASSKLLAEYIPSPYIIDRYRYPIWDSQYPEIPLLILYNKYYLPPYLYVNQQDVDYISSHYVNGYFTRHMLQLLTKTYSNPEVTVFKVPEGVPPSTHSETVLVIPEDYSINYLSSYEMLSLGGYDYTVCLSSDIETIETGKTIIMPCDHDDFAELLKNLESRAEFRQGDKEIIIFNLGGRGPFTTLFFEPKDQVEDVKATHIIGLESTLDLPIEVDAPSLIAREGVKILSWYSNGEEETPFAAELVKDWDRIVYINVYPIMKAGQKEETTADSRQILNFLMSNIEYSKVNDISMYGNDGSVYETEMVDSLFGTAADFDGAKSFIEVTHSDKLNPANEITIEAWIKPKTPDKGFSIVSKKTGYNSLSGYTFLFDGSTFYFNFGNETSYFPNAFPYGRLKVGAWYHLAVTYDEQYVNYYVNGAKVGSVEQSETIGANNLNLLIGKRQDESWKLHGTIYQIVMYNKALKASEIKDSYNKTMEKFWKTNPMSPILGRLIQIAGVALPTDVNYEEWIFEGSTAFFGNTTLTGNVVINSSSFTDIAIEESVNMTIVTDQEETNVTQVKQVYINKTNDAEIRVGEANIHQGKGFYAELTLVNPTLYLSGENAQITLVTSNQKTIEIPFQQGEFTILGQLMLRARTPHFQVNGDAKFEEMYSLFSLYPQFRSSGQDLSIHGAVEFQLTVSDVYTFASNLKWSGAAAREPPILQWNEYTSIKNMVPWLVISVVLVVFWYSFFRKETPQQYGERHVA